MAIKKVFRAIGLMSGTSSDGIDVAYLESNGLSLSLLGGWATYPYTKSFRKQLRRINSDRSNQSGIEKELTELHYRAVQEFLNSKKLNPEEIDLIGFHGHTIEHNPEKSRSVQIGDGELLAQKLNITVFNNFRSNDIRHGGQGAPLAPIFHSKLAAQFERPLAVLNIGGVANVTWIGGHEEELWAFDTGPGNALIDDWVMQHGAGEYDVDGAIAARGSINFEALEGLLNHEYFNQNPPKSLDRNEFFMGLREDFSLEDGAATLGRFTAETVRLSQMHFPRPVTRWIVCGGGQHNKFILSQLRNNLDQPVLVADDVGWHGDAIEAQAFAYLAIRSSLGLPISFPNTTGVSTPLTGGVRHDP